MRPFRVPGAESVIQLMGGIGSSSVQTQGNRLLTEFARLVGAAATFIPAPALVGNKLYEKICSDDRPWSPSPSNGRVSPWRSRVSGASRRRRFCVPVAMRLILPTRTDSTQSARSVMSAYGSSTPRASWCPALSMTV